MGNEKAHEVVITNTVKIADMCEKISPVRPDKCPPVIEHSDQILRNLCYDKAHEIYGETLPPDRGGAAGAGTEFHHFEWVCGYVHHRPEAGVEIECRWLSGWLTWLGWLVLCRDDVRYHGGESAQPSLYLPELPLQ